jgi:regulator of nucleoside diphosphate kinase
LDHAKIVSSSDIPKDVITMNSQVCLVDQSTQKEEVFTLVFPQDADISQGRISVLAPIGTAMLGYRVGQVFQWKVPVGERTLKVKEILYQPEAAGDYHL